MSEVNYEQATLLANELDKTLDSFVQAHEELTVEDVLLGISLLLNNEVESQYQGVIDNEDDEAASMKLDKIFAACEEESLENTIYLLSQGFTAALISVMQAMAELPDNEDDSDDE